MTNSREIAEQAFALLRDALEESESQRRELEGQLDDRAAPASESEQTPESLRVELEAARTDRDLWKKTANQLQDVVANERSKARRLSRKLGTAETGSDRTSRREVNFWREKAELFEEAKRKYQQRIYELKAELTRQEEQLRSQAQNQARLDELDRAHTTLAERDLRISELSAALEAGRQETRQLHQRIDALDAEARGYSKQVIEAEAARNEACRAADLIDAQLKNLQAHTSTYEHEVETLRQSVDQQKSLNEEYQRRIADLETQHEAEINALRDAHGAESQQAKDANAAELAQAHERIDGLESELQDARGGQSDELNGARERISHLESELEQTRSGLSAELNQAREHIAHLESELGEVRSSQSSELDHSRERIARLESELEEARSGQASELSQAHERIAHLESELEQVRSGQADELSKLQSEYAELERSIEAERARHTEQLEHRDAEQVAREQLHASALTQARADTSEAVRAEFEPRVTALTAQLDEQSNAYAALEAELAEERHRSDNLNELANERREAVTKATEKAEEMEERYKDAKWHLEKTRYFEKLVWRRKKLIRNLIKTIRAKQKSGNSLKAGLDSLRRYKANADERQQELLRRVELLENALNESREKLSKANQARRLSDEKAPEEQQGATSGTSADQESANPTDTMQLRNRVSAQAEVIANLEADLKTARIAETEARRKVSELEKLHDDLETKNTFIGTLQKDIEENQKNLAQLRKRDIEVNELRNQTAELERRLAALQSENAQLRNAKGGDIESIDREKLSEQEKAIGRLTAKIKEYEATINTLSEAADSWKRKYDFISAETPYGYESDEAAKQASSRSS